MADPVEVLSPSNISMLKAEISRCVETCNHSVLWPGFVPSRLIDVGTDCEENACVRLITRGDIISKTSWIGPATQVTYAALSYCWGPPSHAEMQCRTEKNSLGERLQNISFGELSPVVRDALIVARKLSIPYLWVDSICIVQDDIMDWENEASLMGLVYSNAYITISGLSSSSCMDGFLERISEVRAAERFDNQEMLDDWHRSSLSSRGWSFQEEKLSTRLILFGFSRIHFCCSNWIYTEGNSSPCKVNERSVTSMGAACNGAELLMEFWTSDLVPQFFQRQFTIPEDRLPAISGMAKYIGDVTGYEYLAGLWKSRLVAELIWSPAPFGGQFEVLLAALGPDAPHYVAPSWSWARWANSNSFSMHFLFKEEEMRFLKMEANFEVSTIQTGPNIYGKVLDAELIITTKVLPVPRSNYHMFLEEIYGGIHDEKNPILVSCVLDWSRRGLDTSRQLKLALVGSYIVPASTRKRYYGILVHPASIVGKYYRVGIFDCPEFERSDLDFGSVEATRIIVI